MADSPASLHQAKVEEISIAQKEADATKLKELEARVEVNAALVGPACTC